MGKYDDIIGLEYVKSRRHTPMSVTDRAAQFSPFAALTGYDEAVDETGRITAEKITLTEDYENDLNEKIRILRDYIQEKPEITVNYFIPDKLKKGGKYVYYTGKVRTFDEYERKILFDDGVKIFVDDIYFIEGEIFEDKMQTNVNK